MSLWQQAFIQAHQLPEAFLLPATQVCERLVQQCLSSHLFPIIAISGPQGSGKTTLAAFVKQYLQMERGLNADTVSLDDYYLSRSARQKLSKDIHPLFQTRGVPGTHEVQRGISDFLMYKSNQVVTLPQFDKSHDSPTHDKASQHLDVLIFEGWCVGVDAEPIERLFAPLNALEQHEDAQGVFRQAVNQQLQWDYNEWFNLIDYLVFIEVESLDSIWCWRSQQEQQLIATKGKGMTPTELQRFMAFFARLTQWGQASLGQKADMHLFMDTQHQMSIKK